MTFVQGVDPLTLSPGEWTFSAKRNALALHGRPGQNEFALTNPAVSGH